MTSTSKSATPTLSAKFGPSAIVGSSAIRTARFAVAKVCSSCSYMISVFAMSDAAAFASVSCPLDR